MHPSCNNYSQVQFECQCHQVCTLTFYCGYISHLQRDVARFAIDTQKQRRCLFQSCEPNNWAFTESDVIHIPTMMSYLFQRWRHSECPIVWYTTLVVRYRLNRLDEPVFMAVPKPMLSEFGIHNSLESCDALSTLVMDHWFCLIIHGCTLQVSAILVCKYTQNFCQPGAFVFILSQCRNCSYITFFSSELGRTKETLQNQETSMKGIQKWIMGREEHLFSAKKGRW